MVERENRQRPLLTRARRDLLRRRSLYVYPRNSFDAAEPRSFGRIALARARARTR